MGLLHSVCGSLVNGKIPLSSLALNDLLVVAAGMGIRRLGDSKAVVVPDKDKCLPESYKPSLNVSATLATFSVAPDNWPPHGSSSRLVRFSGVLATEINNIEVSYNRIFDR